MMPPGVLGQVYVVCAAIGVLFIGINVLMGQLDGGGDDGGASGHDFGSGDDAAGAGSASGHDFGGGDSAGSDSAGSDSAGSDFNAGDNSGNLSKIGHMPNLAQGFGTFILGLLSPMNIAIFLAFFGLTGFVFLSHWPALGLLTLIPAFGLAWLVGQVMKTIVRLMMRSLHTSSHAEEADLLGLIADVNTPLSQGRVGEVTYVIHSKRINSAAKPAKAGMEIKKGTKVLIVGHEDHMVFVEPCEALLIEESVKQAGSS